jgi:hypothetical protein
VAKEDPKRDRDERLARLGLRPPGTDQPRCVHCGRPFLVHGSSGGAVGICQACIDD